MRERYSHEGAMRERYSHEGAMREPDSHEDAMRERYLHEDAVPDLMLRRQGPPVLLPGDRRSGGARHLTAELRVAADLPILIPGGHVHNQGHCKDTFKSADFGPGHDSAHALRSTSMLIWHPLHTHEYPSFQHPYTQMSIPVFSTPTRK